MCVRARTYTCAVTAWNLYLALGLTEMNLCEVVPSSHESVSTHHRFLQNADSLKTDVFTLDYSLTLYSNIHTTTVTVPLKILFSPKNILSVILFPHSHRQSMS